MVFITGAAFAQAPVNDSIQNAVDLTVVSQYCSTDAQYTSVNATFQEAGLPPGWGSQGKDVWFKFTATQTDVNINVTGNSTGGGSTGGTLSSPLIALYTVNSTFNSDTIIVGSLTKSNSVTSFYKGGLELGKTYYIRVSAENNNTGTFRLCVNNYSPPVMPGNNCGTASFLCSKQPFTQTNVVGAGTNTRETVGTCLGGTDSNKAWYKWQVANDGTLTFVITPTVNTDDIDWVLYDFGTSNTCDLNTSIRCAAGHGVDNSGCPTEPLYYKTGLNMTETDLTEAGGCGQGQNGFVKYIDAVAGHYYGLLINNFTNAADGFTLSFGGTAEFVGPKAKFDVSVASPCTPAQTYTFTNQSSNYSSYIWTFGEGATPARLTGSQATTALVTYSTLGKKTAVLQVTTGQGCVVVYDTTFNVGIKPPKPVIDTTRKSYCNLDTMTLSTQVKPNYTYLWTGPNNFSSTLPTVSLVLNSNSQIGSYVLTTTQFGCKSDTSAVVIVSIGSGPVVDFDITPNNLCTPQQSFTITNKSKNYSTLQWDYGTNANTPTVINSNTVNVTYSTYGTKTVTLSATDTKGCTNILAKTLTNPLKPATPVISKSKSLYCIGDSITLSVSAQAAGTTYAWSGPNNYTSTNAVAKIPATATASGTYTLIITQAPCSSDPATFVVNASDIIPNPIASFTTAPTIPSTVYYPDGVTFVNTSTNADSYLWSFGDGTTSTDVNPVHYYSKKGDYTVTLTATNQGTCNNSISKGKILLRYHVTIFIPNTFTPNNDAINDDFRIKMVGIKTYHLQIFNRFGIRLFESTNLTDYWKGTYNGSPVPVGTYYYLIDLVTLNDDKLTESGPVTVIR